MEIRGQALTQPLWVQIFSEVAFLFKSIQVKPFKWCLKVCTIKEPLIQLVQKW